MGTRANRTVGVMAFALLGAALAKELSKPAAERTWTGRVAGLPYDFRPPTLGRIRREFWDPDNDALFTSHAFGVGYGVNLARVLGRRQPVARRV